MWPASQRYLDSLARGGTQVTKVEILHDGVVVATIPDDTGNISLQVVGGNVSVSRQKIRRSGTVYFLDVSGTALPDEVDDLLVPMIAEVRPYVGRIYWDATGLETALGTDREFVPLATLVVTSVQGAYPQVSVSGFDRLWHLSRFTAPYTVVSGTNLGTALSALLGVQIPSAHLALDIPSTDHTTGVLVFDEQSESLDAAHQLATAAGWALYADPMGTIVARPEPSTDDPPVMVYAPGEMSVMYRPDRTVSAENAVNAWKVAGDAADLTAPVSGYWQDNDPNSLTYVGRVGIRPQFQSSGLYRTNAQADLAARTLGTRNLGLADTIAVPIIPNHALESGDVIRVQDPDQGIDFPLVADEFPLPMRANEGVQTINCRSRVIR